MNEKHIEDIITALYDMIQDARAMPLGPDKCILEREKALDMLDEIIAQLPAELKQSRTIVESRNELRILSARHRNRPNCWFLSRPSTERLSASVSRWWSRRRRKSPACARLATSIWMMLSVVLRRPSHSP